MQLRIFQETKYKFGSNQKLCFPTRYYKKFYATFCMDTNECVFVYAQVK